jgi:DNA transformation protein
MTEPATPVNRLVNLGPKSTTWLHAIGVYTVDDIERVGVVEIYRQLKAQGFPVTANLLYALQGALMGIRWDHLPPELRAELRRAVEG